MKNYRNSDYALNKYSEGIVYGFADRIVEVTLADYLAENPGKTEQDFRNLKALSDAIYYQQDRDENAQTKKNVSIHGMEETLDPGCVPLDEQYIEIQDKQYAASAINQLLESGELTEIQHSRFVLYFFKGLTFREIAESEGRSHLPVYRSINAAIKKLKKTFKDQG